MWSSMSNFWNEPSYGRSRHDDSSLSDLDLLTPPATPDALSFRQLVDDARRAVLALPVDAQ